MVSRTLWYFNLMIFVGLLCIFMQIGNTQATFIDDDEDQAQVESSFVNSYAALSDRLNGKVPLKDLFYHKKQFYPDNVQLAKRIIMLPRVGRRSIRST